MKHENISYFSSLQMCVTHLSRLEQCLEMIYKCWRAEYYQHGLWGQLFQRAQECAICKCLLGCGGNHNSMEGALGNVAAGQSTTKLSEEHLLTSLLPPSHLPNLRH